MEVTLLSKGNLLECSVSRCVGLWLLGEGDCNLLANNPVLCLKLLYFVSATSTSSPCNYLRSLLAVSHISPGTGRMPWRATWKRWLGICAEQTPCSWRLGVLSGALALPFGSSRSALMRSVMHSDFPIMIPCPAHCSFENSPLVECCTSTAGKWDLGKLLL